MGEHEQSPESIVLYGVGDFSTPEGLLSMCERFITVLRNDRIPIEYKHGLMAGLSIISHQLICHNDIDVACTQVEMLTEQIKSMIALPDSLASQYSRQECVNICNRYFSGIAIILNLIIREMHDEYTPDKTQLAHILSHMSL
jgi:hypothetical protein